MIFSEQWIREWVDPPINTQQLIDQLTMAGLEVDACRRVAKSFSGIVVGKVIEVKKHPEADKLSVCTVTDGTSEFQVVCGAANVRPGLKVPFAKVGAEILSSDNEKPFMIKKAALRGIESSGMLCSAEELGLEESSAGILELDENAPVGEDARIYLDLDDTSIELDLTPNRGDCLGIIGLAREIGALNKTTVKYPLIKSVPASRSDRFEVSIEANEQCPRYLGRVIRAIDLNARTPGWMREKLRRCGIRSIDPVVDVTNFVLMELGQPMHAFDLAKLQGKITVRLAKEKEKIVLLDGKEVSLDPDTLVIADDKNAVAIAGIMGGLESSVSDDTADVFLECAFFAPLAVAGRARRYGMHTDASHRYERGVDFEIQRKAMERATQLLIDIVGGEAGPITESLGNLPQTSQVHLNYASVTSLLGVAMDPPEIREILSGLGFNISEDSELTLTVNVPSFRFDIEIEEDLIEELVRVYGYNKVPLGRTTGRQALKPNPESITPLMKLKQILVNLGYQEAITYSFIEPAFAANITGTMATSIALQNPISSDMSSMRVSILPGLLGALRHNANRQQERLRIFETGLVFQRDDGQIRQPAMISGLIYGKKYSNNCNNNKTINDFYDIKGDVEALLGSDAEKRGFSFHRADKLPFHGGQCAEIRKGHDIVGVVGGLHPRLQRELGLASQVFMFEIELQSILPRVLPRATVLSRFPEVSRDLAVLVNNETSAADILAVVYENAGEYLTDLRIFDVYQGDAIGEGKKSIALGLTWQHPSRTLTDDEINSIIFNSIKALEEQFNASLRN